MEIGSNGHQAGRKELGFGNRGLASSSWDLTFDKSLWRRKKMERRDPSWTALDLRSERSVGAGSEGKRAGRFL
jgi:hypothetical protein